MLDSETKRRIDTARDILVGKVPDPKSQVEQITIALIYKFMNDMDAEAEGLGGERTFFSGEYERYAWSNLMNPQMGGHDVLNMYAESIQKMVNNVNIPQLFRDIFKNAFLPYRDPETLKSFLKIINDFEYDHSERLGDAFEYLLSVLGSQGDAGQFRTPRHIIDFMVAILGPQKGETILDPACGTSGFLISAYKHILKTNSSNYDPETDRNAFEQSGVKLSELTINGKHYNGDNLTPDERQGITKNVRGYDISPDMVRMSLVNMYLHGFSAPHIYEYDTLTSDERWNEFADVILANPPFMSPKGGIRPHKRFSVTSKRSEVLFVDYMAEHLTPNGRAAIIVPEGIIFQSGAAYKSLRKMLVEENYLVGVISLPAGMFNPYSGVKTSILWLDKALAKKTDKILFAKVEADGFDLGAQRRPVKQNDLPEIFEKIKEYKNALLKGDDIDFEDDPKLSLVEKKKIGENGEYNLSGERYKVTNLDSTSFPLYKLDSLFEILRGGSPRPIQDYITEKSDGINWIRISDAKEGTKYITETKEKIEPEGLKKSRLVEPGDIILSNSMSFGRPYIMKTTGCIHDGWLVLKQIDISTDKDYIYYILSSDLVKKQFEKSATGGVVKNLNINLVKAIQIPLPPLSVQEEIVAEIEGYQKIIDGARQVVENYKPRIAIDPEWEMVELGEYVKIKTGGTPSKSNESFWNGDIPWVSPKDMKLDFINDAADHITNWAVTNSSTMLVPEGTILVVVRSGILKHTLPIAYATEELSFNQDIIAIQADSKKIIPKYLFYYIKSSSATHLRDGIKLGVTVQSFHNGYFKKLRIPLPPLEVQKQIIETIEKEQKIVMANMELIGIFEQKIKDKIAGVWGE